MKTSRPPPGKPRVPPRRRLVVCLDGTWNNRDDSTNVLHHHSLVIEGRVAEAGGWCEQKKFYDTGVGTGVLDQISGGGFGFGLEVNVREAYNWIVEHYRDADGATPADEIYIFGFSRGAYTARSLVGFISRCGLLRRGSPLTVNQLWTNYCVLGRQREGRRSNWEFVFGEERAPSMRQITDLAPDSWDVTSEPVALPENLSEELLVQWSRRVPITFLGIYDTVGALGLDALAIPGIRSKLALHHNMRPTRIVQRCRHALAIHEHRSSFNHTPILEYTGHSGTRAEWKAEHDEWEARIEQRWFPGAHSNVGGGYADNELAQFPLMWLYAEAQTPPCGLQCEDKDPATWPALRPWVVRDSYAEFAAPFWTIVFRAKRHYRAIDPAPVLRAGDRPDPEAGAGFTLGPMNERLDDESVAAFVASGAKTPPNLVRFAERELRAGFDPNGMLQKIVAQTEAHLWIGPTGRQQVGLVLWATLASAGIVACARLVDPTAESPARVAVFAGLALVTAAFVGIDWLESRLNFSLALRPGSALKRALFDALYWLRAVGVVLAVLGAWVTLLHLWTRGWHAGGGQGTAAALLAAIHPWWIVPLVAGFAIAVLTVGEQGLKFAPATRGRAALVALAAGPLVASAAAIAVFLAARLAAHFFPAWVGATDIPAPPAGAGDAGRLLLLEVGLFYLTNTLLWVNGPMEERRLGTSVRLQFAATPSQFARTLEDWAARMRRAWDPESAEPREAVYESLREMLWRDFIGLIPFYGIVLGFGTYLASVHIVPSLTLDIAGVPRWAALLLVAAVANAGANAVTYFLLARGPGQTFPGWATALAFALHGSKWIALAISALLTAGTIAVLSVDIALAPSDAGWRGLIALAIAVVMLLASAGVLIAAPLYRRREKRRFAARRAE